MVFNAVFGHGVVIKHLAVVENVAIPRRRMVEALQLINTREKADKLSVRGGRLGAFVDKVVAMNKKLVKGYKTIRHSENHTG